MRVALFILALGAAIAGGDLRSKNAAAQAQRELQSPGTFSSIVDRAARSKALFLEAAKVITDPRCMNCHPAGDHPLQGADHHIHQPTAFRGEAKQIYLVYPAGIGTSKLTGSMIEKKLRTRGTARNWNTTLKMLELASAPKA